MADPTIDRDDTGDAGKRGFSRRRFLGAGAAGAGGVAAAVVFGTGLRPASAAPPSGGKGPLAEADPHVNTGPSGSRARLRPRPDGLVILPIDRAKFQAGMRFDLRIEATGVDTETSRINIAVRGPSGPARLLTDDPVRTSSEPDSFVVTYLALRYPEPGTYTITASVTSDTSRPAAARVTHEVVVARAGARTAKNVIF
ncbi:MAG: hypothetical protein H0V64_00520, partial [Geodermatophilaceae bacterium]|nr:hypothetical protein [Geodermatophilaceae bacterium]